MRHNFLNIGLSIHRIITVKVEYIPTRHCPKCDFYEKLILERRTEF